MQPETKLAVGAALVAFAQGSTPVRRPSWEQPPFYSRPMTRTKTRYAAAMTTDWTDFLTIEGKLSYVGRIQRYSLGCENAMATSGIRFRFLLDGSPLPFVTLPEDAEICRDTSVTTWPLFTKDFCQIILSVNRFTVQIKNLNPLAQRVFVGLYGFFYPDVDASAQSDVDDQRLG